MRLLGRILLIIAGVWILASAIPSLIFNIQNINAFGWQNLFANATGIAYFVVLVIQGIFALVGLGALYSGIRGRVGFITIFSSVIMIIGLVLYFIFMGNAGLLTGWQKILQAISMVACPILYVTGAILLTYGRK